MRRLARGPVLLAVAVAALGSGCSTSSAPSRPPTPAAPDPAAAPSVVGVAGRAEPDRPVARETTANWAGRAAVPAAGQAPLAAAGMRLAIPAVTCPAEVPGGTAMVSVWAGLGGWRGGILYQAGFEATCAAGNPIPAYDAFTEAVRTGSGPVLDVVPHTVLTPLATHPVAPGDVLTVRVSLTAAPGAPDVRAVRFAVSDAGGPDPSAPRWTEVVPVTLPAPEPLPSSAECIVERPTLTDPVTGTARLAPLPGLAPVFDGPDDDCTATDVTGRAGLLGDASDPWPETAIAMTDDGAPQSALLVGGVAVPAGRPLAIG